MISKKKRNAILNDIASATLGAIDMEVLRGREIAVDELSHIERRVWRAITLTEKLITEKVTKALTTK